MTHDRDRARPGDSDRARPGDLDSARPGDLTTLLRDAGRGPTVDLDVDAVHTRGRRRAVGRRVGAGLGALALAGAVAVGISALTPDPVPFVGDEVPSEQSAPAPAPSDPASSEAAPDEAAPDEPAPTAGDHTQDRFTPQVAMADLGVTVVDAVRSQDGAGGLQLRVVTSEGVVEDFSTLAGSLPPLHGQVVVEPDLTVWANDVDPNLLVGSPDDTLGRPAHTAVDGMGWTVLGAAVGGGPLVTPGIGPDAVFTEESRGVEVWRDGTATPIPGITGAPTLTEASPVAAAMVAERLAVLAVVGETTIVDLHVAGTDPVALAETGGLDRWFTDLAIVGDEVWITEQRDGVTDLWLVPMDGREARRVPTPLGRDGGDRFVTALQAVDGPDGPVVTLSARGEDGTARSWVVDVDLARSGSLPGEVAADAVVPPGAYRLLDAEGRVLLLPPGSSDQSAAPAACATDEDAPLNAAPNGLGGQVWWLCPPAADRLPEGVGYPFVASERVTGGNGTADEVGLAGLLAAWTAGPTDVEQDAGLVPAVEPGLLVVEQVVIEGEAVTVVLTSTGSLNNLSTSYASGALVRSIVGIVLQHDALATVQVLLDGSCERWGGLTQEGGCPTYDAADAPWNQG